MNETTIVADVGARYGMHPSWSGFDAPLRYYAFEPDQEEAERLRTSYAPGRNVDYIVLATALDKFDGERDFHLLKHRALSSCLKPDLESECFRHLKPGQAEIERTVKVQVRRLDEVFAEQKVAPDFLKIDTEGTEHDVIEGAGALITTSVLGVRSSCNFQRCFHGQKLFSESHDYLLDHDFVLLNIDYKGFGYPRLGLFRKPDPTEGEDFRYGFLVAADAVWIRRVESVDRSFAGRDRGLARLKLAFFCMLNNAPDVGLDFAREARKRDSISKQLEASHLYAAFRLRAARFLGRWRTVPDDQWDKARRIYAEIFDEELAGGSEFYPQIQKMVTALATGP
jgi:FkbM family methyltransferase